jgi:ribonuclease HII
MVANNEEENKLLAQGFRLIGAVDESAMGCFAGDVYVGLVIFPAGIDYRNLTPGINDSKQKTPEQREILYNQIHQHALAYATATASVEEIDRLNIYWARFLAVYRALAKITVKPDYLIIDGNKTIPTKEEMIYKIRAGFANSPEQMHKLSEEIESASAYITAQHAIVKGDAKSISIAAASILAKVERDKHIEELARKVHSDYDWIHNKSYYCEKQINAIKKYGKTIYHREVYVRKYLV